METAGPIQWRRDASTSRTIRLCWTLGTGTFLGAITLMASARVFALAGEGTGPAPVGSLTVAQLVIVATLFAVAVTVLALALAHHLGHRIPFVAGAGTDTEASEGGAGTERGGATDTTLDRVLDAGVGAVVMGGIIVALAWGGGDHGEMLAAATIPIALVVIAVSVFLRSTGTLDLEEGVLYLHDPDDAIDLDAIEAVSARYVGQSAIVRLRYAQPDNQYVPGPRRLVLPPGVARDLEAMVGSE